MNASTNGKVRASMAEKQRQRKMVDIDVVETSGVDHPAHLAEGWIVCKSATAQDVEGIFGPLTTEGNATMATNDQTAAPTVESLTKALEERDNELAAAKAELEKAQAAPAKTEPEDVLKGLPAEVREMLAKAEQEREDLRKQAEQTREDLQKERDARLDDQARTAAAAMFKSVALDTNTVGPALRRLELIDADLHKSVTEALKAADAQLQTARLFKSVGSGDDTEAPALGKLDAAAAELMKADASLTKPQAIAKAAEANPDLYTEYQNQKAGA